jgi:hypothetical protein
MHKGADVAFVIVLVAGAFVLTRPGSQGAKVITAFGNAFSGAISAATGGTTTRNVTVTRKRGK